MFPRILRTLLAAACTLALLAFPAPSAGATSRSGTDSRPDARAVLGASSPYYRKLPAATPAAADSGALVASLVDQSHKFYGSPTVESVTVNYARYSPALYVAYDTDPVYDITGYNCQHKANGWDKQLNEQLRNVHIPVDMQPDPSSDGSVSIYDVDNHVLVELWEARKVDGRWQACWGGKITAADKSPGTFTLPYGASASGLALWGGTIRQQELLDGHITHPISLGIPRTKKGTVSWPANRSDGFSTGTELAIGQMLRLPASLDLSSMKLSPAAMTIAKAAQEYGIIITDTSGSVAFSAENPIALARNDYATIFRGKASYEEMIGNKSKGEVPFPLDDLVALPLDYQVPTATPTDPTAPPVPNTAYARAVKAAKPAINWRLDDTGSRAVDASGKKRDGTLRGVSEQVAGAIAGSKAIATSGAPSSVVYQKKAAKPSTKFTVQVWFRTQSDAGGKLLGFENTRTGKGSRHDRSLYLTTEGKLVFGTHDKKVSTVVSTTSYNDGAWHLATATQGSSGTRLYVDGGLVASNATKKARSGSGYWRLGGGNLAGWPHLPANPWFAGSLDEFAYYPSALSPATVFAQYRAAA